MKKATMKKRVRTAGKGILTVAAASLLLAFPAAAEEPMDELNAIMEKQFEAENKGLLEETIGFSEMGKAMKEEGLSFSLDMGLLDGTLEMLGMGNTIFEDGTIHLQTQVDPVLKKWLLQAGAGLGEEDLFDLTFIGEENLLSVLIPQFFDGAVSLRSGNLAEQYEGSSLQQLIGEEELQLPDIDLKFYPEEMDEAGQEMLGSFRQEVEEAAAQFEEALIVEKTEAQDETLYQLTCQTSDVMDLYRVIMKEYVELFQMAGMFADGREAETEASLDEMLEQLQSAMGEEVTVNFHVQDELLTSLDYELYMDTSALSGSGYEKTEEDGSFCGPVKYEMSFVDPENPWDLANFHMLMTDEASGQQISMEMSVETKKMNGASETNVSVEMKANDEVLYSGIPLNIYFDSASGDLDASFIISDGEDTVGFLLDSTFSEVEKGKSFLWTIDKLSMEANGEAIGLNGQIRVAADAGEIAEPEKQQVLLELEPANLLALITEFSTKVQIWGQQFEDRLTGNTDQGFEENYSNEPESDLDEAFSVEPESDTEEVFSVELESDQEESVSVEEVDNQVESVTVESESNQ